MKKACNKSCANCGEAQAHLLVCARCTLTEYCSKACQKQHWKDHKKHCVTKHDRAPKYEAAAVNQECPICLGDLKGEYVLPCCQGNLHFQCFNDLLESKTTSCPLCRAFLPSKVAQQRYILAQREKNLKKSVHLMLEAAMLGHDQAQIRVATVYETNEQFDKALSFFKMAAESGNVEAMLCTGEMYYKGCGMPVDCLTASSWFYKSAKKGCYNSQYNLVRMMVHREIPLNKVEMARFMQALRHVSRDSSTVTIDGEGMYHLGLMYACGEYVEKNYEIAAEYFSKGAEKGCIFAQFQMALLYLEGNGVGKNLVSAVRYFKMAVEQKCGISAYNIGVIAEGYNRGETALKWYKKATELGFSYEHQKRVGMGESVTGLTMRPASVLEMQAMRQDHAFGAELDDVIYREE